MSYLPVETSPELDPRALRDALGNFATGITVITTCTPDGEWLGLTVNSFNSVSLDPPLVLWSLALTSPSVEIIRHASHYAVNVLTADQLELSQRFASRIPDKFAGVECVTGVAGMPLLADCCAWFECRNEFQYPGGDHVILVGHVERFALQRGKEPLLYHGGQYRWLAPSQG